jgi:hypothetical protein
MPEWPGIEVCGQNCRYVSEDATSIGWASTDWPALRKWNSFTERWSCVPVSKLQFCLWSLNLTTSIFTPTVTHLGFSLRRDTFKNVSWRMESGGKAPCILNLCTNSKLRTVYPRVKSHRYPFARKFGRAQGRSALAGHRTPNFQPVTNHFTKLHRSIFLTQITVTCLIKLVPYCKDMPQRPYWLKGGKAAGAWSWPLTSI